MDIPPSPKSRRGVLLLIMLKIAVVDDSPKDSEKLLRAVNKWFFENHREHKIEIFDDGANLLRVFETGKFDIIFMDIIMDTLTGIETAKRLREIDSSVLIVFATSSSEFVFDAFPLHPFDYILKPYDPEKVVYVLNEAVKILERPEDCIDVKTSRSSYKIPLKNISAVISKNHGIEVFMNGDSDSIICPMTFSEIKNELENKKNFLEINRGVIVNMDCVMSLSRDKRFFIMKDGSNMPINIRRHKSITETFTQYQISRLRAAGRNKNGN